MPVTAELKLKSTTLLVHQSTEVVAEITNDTKEPLSYLNPVNNGGSPDYVLTDLETGESEVFKSLRPPGGVPKPVHLAPKQALKDEFFLTDRFQFSKPGKFELRADYAWDGGSATISSQPVKLEVLPATPRALTCSSIRGSAAPAMVAAWVHAVDAAKGKFEIWLSEISTSRKPKVRDSMLIGEVGSSVEPFVSVPPAVPPTAQWMAWQQEGKLCTVLMVNRTASTVSAHQLPFDDYRIVPPVLLDVVKKGEVIPGLDVLLIRSMPAGGGNQFLVARSSAGDTKVEEITAALPAGLIPWARTAYLEGGKRLTFLVLAQQDQTVLAVSQWAAGQVPQAIRELHAWRGKFVAADLCWTQENVVHGMLLLDQGVPDSRSYSFESWSSDGQGAFAEGRSTPLAFPLGQNIATAVCRVDEDGLPYALIRLDDKAKTWRFCGPSGDVGCLTGPAEQIKLPVDILFRKGSDPVVLFCEPQRGIQLVRPQA